LPRPGNWEEAPLSQIHLAGIQVYYKSTLGMRLAVRLRSGGGQGGSPGRQARRVRCGESEMTTLHRREAPGASSTCHHRIQKFKPRHCSRAFIQAIRLERKLETNLAACKPPRTTLYTSAQFRTQHLPHLITMAAKGTDLNKDTPTQVGTCTNPGSESKPYLGFASAQQRTHHPWSPQTRTFSLSKVWRGLLSAQEFEVLRNKGTERPGSGPFNKHFEEGTYSCAGCGTPLYRWVLVCATFPEYLTTLQRVGDSSTATHGPVLRFLLLVVSCVVMGGMLLVGADALAHGSLISADSTACGFVGGMLLVGAEALAHGSLISADSTACGFVGGMREVEHRGLNTDMFAYASPVQRCHHVSHNIPHVCVHHEASDSSPLHDHCLSCAV